MESAPNPYAAPLTDTEAPLDAPSDELEVLIAIRKQHINAEANIKSVGSLDYFASLIMFVSAIAAFSPLPTTAFGVGRAIGAFVVSAGMGAGTFYLGFKTRELSPGARIAQTVFLVLGALAAFVSPGALFWSLVIAYILWSGKARVVFSEHYRNVVIPATPEIKYRSSLLTVIGALLLIALFAGIIAGAFGWRR